MTVNDNFANRTLLSGLALNGQGSNIGATAEVGEPAQSGIANSVWWSWTAPNDGTFTIDTKNSNFDTCCRFSLVLRLIISLELLTIMIWEEIGLA
jgi:hypothetical protein